MNVGKLLSYRILIALFLYSNLFCQKKHEESICSHLRLIQRVARDNCILSRLLDKNKNEFFFKQRVHCSAHEYLEPILEALGAFIAQSIDIPCNKTVVVSTIDTCRHKTFKDKPASLHTKVPGIPARSVSMLRNIDISQNFLIPNAKYKGFSHKTISSMSFDSQLAKFVALDLFIGNVDRAQLNYLYDEVDNKFYGIDFGWSFKENLCARAITCITRLVQSGVQFNQKEILALIVCKRTLKQLIDLYPLEKLIQKFDYFIDQAKLLEVPLYCPEEKIIISEASIKAEIDSHKRAMSETVVAAKELIKIISDILKAKPRDTMQEKSAVKKNFKYRVIRRGV